MTEPQGNDRWFWLMVGPGAKYEVRDGAAPGKYEFTEAAKLPAVVHSDQYFLVQQGDADSGQITEMYIRRDDPEVEPA